jgi:hypothetical protein
MPALRRDLLSSVFLDHHVAAFDAPQEIDVQGQRVPFADQRLAQNRAGAAVFRFQ